MAKQRFMYSTPLLLSVLAVLLLLVLPTRTVAFGTTASTPSATRRASTGVAATSDADDATTSTTTNNGFDGISLDMPPSNSGLQAKMNIAPLLSVPSELVVVRYALPFGLSVEPKKGLAVVTKAGNGSINGANEQPGDILRFTSQWTLGLPQGDGLVTTAASFAGGLSWQCSLYNVQKAKAWEQVVNALTSNIEDRTDQVVMIFERPLNGVVPPELQ